MTKFLCLGTLLIVGLVACGSPPKAEPLRALTPEETAIIVVFNNPADNEILRKHGQFVSSAYYASEARAKIHAYQRGGNVVEVFTTSNHTETKHEYQGHQYKPSIKTWKRSMAIIHRLPEEFVQQLSVGPKAEVDLDSPQPLDSPLP